MQTEACCARYGFKKAADKASSRFLNISLGIRGFHGRSSFTKHFYSPCSLITEHLDSPAIISVACTRPRPLTRSSFSCSVDAGIDEASQALIIEDGGISYSSPRSVQGRTNEEEKEQRGIEGPGPDRELAESGVNSRGDDLDEAMGVSLGAAAKGHVVGVRWFIPSASQDTHRRSCHASSPCVGCPTS